METNKCLHCKKKLRAFIKEGTDWKSRQYHKTCYKIVHEEECGRISYENYVRDVGKGKVVDILNYSNPPLNPPRSNTRQNNGKWY